MNFSCSVAAQKTTTITTSTSRHIDQHDRGLSGDASSVTLTLQINKSLYFPHMLLCPVISITWYPNGDNSPDAGLATNAAPLLSRKIA